jgi:hypothetical protein
MRDFLEFCQTRQVPDRQIDWEDRLIPSLR